MFLNELYTVNTGRNRWVLTEPLSFVSMRFDMMVCAPKGFVTDYASVPRIPFVFAATGNTGHKAAVIHDYLYTDGKKNGWSRKAADLVFYDALLETEPQWRAALMYAGVRVGGWRPWHKNK